MILCTHARILRAVFFPFFGDKIVIAGAGGTEPGLFPTTSIYYHILPLRRPLCVMRESSSTDFVWEVVQL